MNDDLLMPPKKLAAAAARLRAGLPAPAEPKRRRKPKAKAIGVPTIQEFTEGDPYLGLSLTPAQRAMLKATFGEPLTDEELPLFCQITGRTKDPRRVFSNLTGAAGARGGKSGFIAAPAALWHAFYGDHRPARGERIRIGLFAQNQEAAEIIFTYFVEYVEGSPKLKTRVIGKPRKNRMVVEHFDGYEVTIQTFPCTAKAARGYSFAVVVLDEVAFYRFTTGAANQDTEIEASVRRGMLAQKNPLLIKISTPYAKDWILYRDIKEYFGRDDSNDVLVFRAPSIVLNPVTIAGDRLAQEQRLLDPDVFAREFEAEFIDAASAWLPYALIEAATDPGAVIERPWFPEFPYTMAIDASGGSSCGFAAAVGHVESRDGQKIFVLDVCRSWAKPKDGKLDLRAVMNEVADLARLYNVEKIYSDRYAAEWPRQWMIEISAGKITIVDPELNRQEGQTVHLTKSQAFVECGPHFRTGAIRLLDIPSLQGEFRNLEVRPLQGGKLYIGRPKARGLLDDQATAVATAAAMALGKPESGFSVTAFVKSYGTQKHEARPTRYAGDARWQHPHERDEPMTVEADVRMGKGTAARWRAVLLNNGQRPTPTPTP